MVLKAGGVVLFLYIGLYVIIFSCACHSCAFVTKGNIYTKPTSHI